MGIAVLLMAAAVFGVETGWEPAVGGGVKYIIQIPPEHVDLLRGGTAFECEIPPAVLRQMRAYRIQVGVGPLRRTLPKVETPREPAPLPADPGTRPLVGQQAVYVDGPSGQPPKPAAAPPVETPSTAEPPKPWTALWMTLLALFASLGGNVFFGWVAWDSRRQVYASRSA